MFAFGDRIRIQIFGQSHSEAIGVVIDGMPAGEHIDFDKLQAFLDRRAPGKAAYTTKRNEPDIPEFLSGIADGKTCGSPICAVIRNKDQRSGDYAKLKEMPRPGHADYPAFIKYGGSNDIRGGGQFSGRMTAPLCIAGGIIKQMLERRGIYIGAHILEIHGVRDASFDAVNVDREMLESVAAKPFAVIDDNAAEPMQKEIMQALGNCDSVGGIIELVALGLPVGLGSHMFGGVENLVAAAVFGVPAVKGIEFGAGFGAAKMYGSQNNDSYYIDNGTIKTKTNNAGGVLGGMTTGMPLIIRAAIKPTPSIAAPQQTVSLTTMSEQELKIVGRHDPCIVPRAVPAIESAVAVALAQLIF